MIYTLKPWFCNYCKTNNPDTSITCLKCGLTPLKHFGMKINNKENIEK